jgi:hypothetical protein
LRHYNPRFSPSRVREFPGHFKEIDVLTRAIRGRPQAVDLPASLLLTLFAQLLGEIERAAKNLAAHAAGKSRSFAASLSSIRVDKLLHACI